MLLFGLFSFIFAAKKCVVLDGGSTGTRAFIIQYEDVDDIYTFIQVNKTGCKAGQVCDPAYFGGAPAFNDMKPGDTKQMDEISKQIVDLLFTKGVDTLIPERERPSVTVLVYSTAGMRLLSKDQQNAINTHFYNYLKLNTKYSVDQKDVRTLLGYEESLYQWLTINQISYAIGSGNRTVAMMSMGGASTQFTLELKYAPDDDFVRQFVYHVTVSGKMHYLYQYSFLEYGTNVWAPKMHQPRYDRKNFTTPCMYDGGQYSTQIFTKEKPDEQIWFDFLGVADLQECYDMVTEHLPKPTDKSLCHGMPALFRDTSVDGDNCVPCPEPFTELYGMSIVQDAVKYISPRLPDKGVTLPELKTAANKFAETYNYTQVIELNDGDDNAMWSLSNQAMVLNFLQRGFEDVISGDKITLVTKEVVNGKLVEWQLGAAIARFSSNFKIIQAKDDTFWKPGVIAGICIACAVVVGVVVGLSVYFYMRSKRLYNPDLQKDSSSNV